MTLTEASVAYERRRRIERGIERLDELGPSDWRQHVVLGLLNMNDPQVCVLGQVYRTDAGHYQDGYSFGQSQLLLGSEDPSHFGFDNVVGESYRDLTDAWLEALR